VMKGARTIVETVVAGCVKKAAAALVEIEVSVHTLSVDGRRPYGLESRRPCPRPLPADPASSVHSNPSVAKSLGRWKYGPR
jgi:hypothetical protein